MSETLSTNFKRKILQKIKQLNESGKHAEATQLYKKYFI